MTDWGSFAGTIAQAQPTWKPTAKSSLGAVGQVIQTPIPTAFVGVSGVPSIAAGTYAGAVPSAVPTAQAPLMAAIQAVAPIAPVPIAIYLAQPSVSIQGVYTFGEPQIEAGLKAIAGVIQGPVIAKSKLVQAAIAAGAGIYEIKPSEIKLAEPFTFVPVSERPTIKYTQKVEIIEPFVPAVEMRLHIMALGADLSGHPETDEEKQLKWKQTLDQTNPAGISNGDNALAAKYFWQLIPAMTQKQIDPHAVANLARIAEALINGDGSVLYYAPWFEEAPESGDLSMLPFSQLSTTQQQAMIASLAKNMYEAKLPPGYASILINNVIVQAGSAAKVDELYSWSTTGGLDRAIAGDLLYGIKTGIKGFVSTPAGQMSIGGVIAAVGIIGAVATGGIAPAMMAAGTSIFSVTELANYFGFDSSRIKSSLQATGSWGPDRSYQYDQNFSSAKSTTGDIQFKLSKTDPQVNLDNLARAKKSLAALSDQLGNDSAFLAGLGTYDDELRRYDELKGSYDASLTMFDAQGNYIQKAQAPVSFIYSGLPEGYKITAGGVIGGSGGQKLLTVNESTEINPVIIGPDGKEYIYPTVKLSPGLGDKTISDLGSWIEKQKQYGGAVKVTPMLPVTLDLRPNQTAYIGDQKYVGGVAGAKISLEYPQGTPLSIKFSEPGKKDDVVNSLVLAEQGTTISRFLEDVYKPEVRPTTGLVKPLIESTQTFYIDGVNIKGDELTRGGYLTPGYHNVLITEPGYEPYEKTVYIAAGEITTIAGKGYPIRGSEGGGGGGGGGEETVAQPTAQALISFGPSLVGARIWLDNTEVTPVIGQSYSVAPGYHAIKATKSGYKDFNKTVYAMEGTTLNIDAAFEPIVGYVSPTETTPSTGATPSVTVGKGYVIFTSTIIGVTVYIDERLISVTPGLAIEYPYGYHGIKLTKAGKVDWIKNVYLAQGDTLTVSPIFEDLPTTTPTTPTMPTETTKRVYINTKPDGAKILINDGFTGQWTPGYLDLERGIYKLTITKSGYASQASYIYVGDVIAFGDTAVSLARLANLEVPL